MTTEVTVKAHCGDDTEVSISIAGEHTGENAVIQNGEEFTGYVYDDRVLTVRETKKELVTESVK